MGPSGDIGILTTDRELVVQSWDAWLVTVTSIAADDARGRPLRDLAPRISERRMLARIEETLATGAVQVLSPALHPAMLPSPPRTPSEHFPEMQQRVTIGPLLNGAQIAGLLITIQDVTAQFDRERALAAAMASENPEVRRVAAEKIAAGQRLESFEQFSPALGSENWRVRYDAVRGLAAATDLDLLRAVLSTLQREHRNFSALSSALKLLALSEVDVTGPLAELLQDHDVDLRIQAALALGEQHQPGATSPLLRALEDPDQNVRFHVIEALGRLRAESAIEPLVSIVESRDFFLSFAALEALSLIHDSRVAPRLVPLLEDEDLRDGVAHALSHLGDEHAVEPLVHALNRTPDATEAVANALAAIADRLTGQGLDDLNVAAIVQDTLSPAGRAHLMSAADTATPTAQAAVARVLAWLPGDDSVQSLGRIAETPFASAAAVDALLRHRDASVDAFVQMLESEDADLQVTAVAALGTLGSRRAATPLLDLLHHNHDEGVPITIAACGALARIADAAAFEPLLGLVGHVDQAVRQAAIGALNSIGHEEMPARVTRLLRDEDPLVRESAVRIAGYFGYPDSLPLVVSCATDEIEAVRVACLEHLPFFESEQVMAILHSALLGDTARARAAAARALARIESPQALDLLSQALNDEDQWVRYYAARAIGEQRNGQGVPRLTELAEADPSLPVRIAALDAIGIRGSQDAFSALLRSASSAEADVAAAAVRALGRLGGDRVLDTLRSSGRADDVRRRRAAVEGLGAHQTAEAVAQLEWIAAADPDAAVGDLAIGALADIASAEIEASPAAIGALLSLCAVPERRDAAAARLGGLPVATLPEVARGLDHRDPVVRRRTVDVLARFRRPEATRHMDAALVDTDPVVRETAVVALMRLGSTACDDALRQLAAEDPSKAVRRAAAAVIASRRAAR